MAIPDYQSLMLPVLTVAAAGETRVPAAAQVIADRLGLTENEREEMLPSGKQRLLHNRVHWTKFYLTTAGLIDSPKRGVFVALPAGRQMLATSPTRIDVEALKRIPAFMEFYTQAGTSTETDAPSQVASIAATTSDATPETPGRLPLAPRQFHPILPRRPPTFGGPISDRSAATGRKVDHLARQSESALAGNR